MNQVGGLMFGAQVGQGLGGLAREVVSATDIGLPLGPTGVAALSRQNVAAFGEGLERPGRRGPAVPRAARGRAPAAVRARARGCASACSTPSSAYARGITVDMSAIEQAMGEHRPDQPARACRTRWPAACSSRRQTPEQQAALRRLETLLALVEGWVDAVVAAAAGDRMPGAEALREASRRRRATGGPAEQTFATLVGLELRPRRLREAAALWWSVTEKHGVSGRDAIWSHPDLLPTADDLDDPLGFADTIGLGRGLRARTTSPSCRPTTATSATDARRRTTRDRTTDERGDDPAATGDATRRRLAGSRRGRRRGRRPGRRRSASCAAALTPSR